MRMLCSALGIAFLTLASSLAGAAGIRGDYVEARTADVFTGPCFSNAEVFIYGNHAVLAWKVTKGRGKGSTSAGCASLRPSMERRPSPRINPTKRPPS